MGDRPFDTEPSNISCFRIFLTERAKIISTDRLRVIRDKVSLNLDGRGSVCAARLEIQSSSSLKLSTMNATTKIPHDTRGSSRDAIIPCKCSLGFLPFSANKDFNPEDSASDLSLLDLDPV